MRVIFFTLSLLLPFFAAAPVFAQTAEIVRRGLIDCFPEGTETKKGKTRFCEASAAVYLKDRKKLIVAIDKKMPKGFSPVFSLTLHAPADTPTVDRYYTKKIFRKKIRKIEAMTLSPDGKTVFASTAFDRIKCDSAKWDRYNVLLAWPSDNPDSASIVSPSERDGAESSRRLRTAFAKALSVNGCPDPQHLKIEGLAAIPGNKLLFGVREVGASHEKFSYVVKIIETAYTVKDGVPDVAPRVLRVYDAGKLTVPGGRTVGLSSVEYDSYHDRLYLLTSFEAAESDEGLGGFLWVLPMADYRAGKPPTPVRDRQGRPLMFAHKSEGLAILDKNHIMVIHDDDRILGRDDVTDPRTQFHREPHQAAYTVVYFD